MLNSAWGNAAAPNPGRRASDRRYGERRLQPRRRSDRGRSITWDEQRSQFITRFLFGALGLAYFNMGHLTARSPEYLVAINLVHLAYFALTAAFLVHARLRVVSPLRLRLAMWTDVVGVSAAVMADASPMAPAYLVYLVIVLGNGMRYGLRAFAEAALSGLVAATVVLSLRFPDYVQNLSVTSLFFLLFVGIIVAYAYGLMVNIERARQGLEVASSVDALTGLLNRRGLQERAQGLFGAVVNPRTQFAVLFADLDGFKAINDAHGHDAGDRLLKEVARAIRSAVRDGDTVARFGGDEFVVILPETTLEQATVIAKRMQAAVSKDERALLTLTIGMGLAPTHGADLDAVLKSVDVAMYHGKQTLGRGGVCRADGVAVA